ncbi:hypothetical protein ACIP39_12240 [Streptomyces tibetensis]
MVQLCPRSADDMPTPVPACPHCRSGIELRILDRKSADSGMLDGP